MFIDTEKRNLDRLLGVRQRHLYEMYNKIICVEIQKVIKPNLIRFAIKISLISITYFNKFYILLK